MAMIGLIALLLFGGLYLVVRQTPPKKKSQKSTAQHKQVFMPSNMERKLGVTGVSSELERMKRENLALQKKLATMEDTVKSLKGAIPDAKAIQAAVEKKLQEDKKHPSPSPGEANKPPVGPPKPQPAPPAGLKADHKGQEWWSEFQKGQKSTKPVAPSAASKETKPAMPEKKGPAVPGAVGKKDATPKPGEIRVVSAKDNKEATAGVTSVKDKKKEAGTYIPSGSIFSGTLLSGMDVSTGEGSRRDPHPVLLRIKKEAILPNRYRTDVKECFLVASGYGDLSSERAYVRAERMSCIREDGKALEAKVEMYAVGEDGKAGIRGRVVNKTGALLGKALIAGFLEGFSKIFGKNQVMTFQTGSLGSNAKVPFESYLSKDAMQSAGLSGAGSAMERLAKYYIDMAENIYPVIEIDAGRAIDFILLNGVSLQLQQGQTTVTKD